MTDPGYNYCKGLYNWYTNSSNDALLDFNRARTHPELGLMATYHMIEICLNPENEMIGGETFDSVDANLTTIDKLNVQEAAYKTAEKLLNVRTNCLN